MSLTLDEVGSEFLEIMKAEETVSELRQDQLQELYEKYEGDPEEFHQFGESNSELLWEE